MTNLDTFHSCIPRKFTQDPCFLSVDILIIGSGLIGAALMLTLTNTNYNLLLVDTHSFQERTDSSLDSRSLALSPASTRILQTLDIWPALQSAATPIESIHVSEQFRFGATRLKAKNTEPLGHVIEIQTLYKSLSERLNQENILTSTKIVSINTEKKEVTVEKNNKTLIIQAKIIVAADGSDSLLRHLLGLESKTKDYQQQAITCNVELSRFHDNRAFERFTPSGAIAFLPLNNNRASLVWIASPEKAQCLFNLKETLFLKELQQSFGYKLGKLTRIGKRTIFPLKQVVMPKKIAWPAVFIGNAAHTLHPIAGQGFNLGLRDVASLAQCIMKYGMTLEMLTQYESMRDHDQKAILFFTDYLIKTFISKFPGIGFLRNMGLLTMDLFPILKTPLTHYARGFGGHVPDLACKIPLFSKKYDE